MRVPLLMVDIFDRLNILNQYLQIYKTIYRYKVKIFVLNTNH